MSESSATSLEFLLFAADLPIYKSFEWAKRFPAWVSFCKASVSPGRAGPMVACQENDGSEGLRSEVWTFFGVACTVDGVPKDHARQTQHQVPWWFVPRMHVLSRPSQTRQHPFGSALLPCRLASQHSIVRRVSPVHSKALFCEWKALRCAISMWNNSLCGQLCSDHASATTRDSNLGGWLGSRRSSSNFSACHNLIRSA